MSLHDDIAVLEELSQRIATIPERTPKTYDGTTVAGNLMLQAMKHGLFSEPKYIELRQRIEMSLNGGFEHQQVQKACPIPRIIPPPGWHAFRNTGNWFSREAGRQELPYDREWLRIACEDVSRCIGERVIRIKMAAVCEHPVMWLESRLHELINAMLDLRSTWAAHGIAEKLHSAEQSQEAVEDRESQAEAVLRAVAAVREALPGIDALIHESLELKRGAWSRELAESLQAVASMITVSASDLNEEGQGRFLECWRVLNRKRQQLESTDTTSLRSTVDKQSDGDDCTLTVTEVSKLTGFSTGQVSRMCNAGELVNNGKSGRDRRISKESVIQLARKTKHLAKFIITGRRRMKNL